MPAHLSSSQMIVSSRTDRLNDSNESSNMNVYMLHSTFSIFSPRDTQLSWQLKSASEVNMASDKWTPSLEKCKGDDELPCLLLNLAMWCSFYPIAPFFFFSFFSAPFLFLLACTAPSCLSSSKLLQVAPSCSELCVTGGHREIMTESSRQTSRVGSILATDLARPKAASSFALKWSAQIGGTDGWTDGRISIRIRVALWRLAQLCAVSGPYITTDSLKLSLMSLSALICIEIRGNESEFFFFLHTMRNCKTIAVNQFF